VLLVSGDPGETATMLDSFARHSFRYSLVPLSSGEDAVDFMQRSGRHAGRMWGGEPKLIVVDVHPRDGGTAALLSLLRGMGRTRYASIVVLARDEKHRAELEARDLGPTLVKRRPRRDAEYRALVRCLESLLADLPSGG